jgi:hypothetical protein
MTVSGEPPRASVMAASATAVGFSEIMRKASALAADPPPDSFISLRPITRCVSTASIAVSKVNRIQFLNINSPELGNAICRSVHDYNVGLAIKLSGHTTT